MSKDHVAAWPLFKFLVLLVCYFQVFKQAKSAPSALRCNKVVKQFDEILQLGQESGNDFMAVLLAQSDLTYQDLKDLQCVLAMMPEALFTSDDSIPVIFDIEATKPVTFDQSDFVGPLRRPALPMMMKEIVKGLKIHKIKLLE